MNTRRNTTEQNIVFTSQSVVSVSVSGSVSDRRLAVEWLLTRLAWTQFARASSEHQQARVSR